MCQYTLGAMREVNLPDEGRLEVEINRLTAPVKLGQQVGEARLVLEGQVVAVSPLLAGEAVPKSWFLVMLVWSLWGLGGVVAAALLVRTNAKIIKIYRRRRRGLTPQGGRPRLGGPRSR